MIHVSANGEVLGEFEESAVPELLASGKIPAGAFYWREGMKEWLPVQELGSASPSTARTLPIKPQADQTPRSGMVQGAPPSVLKLHPKPPPAEQPVTQPVGEPLRPAAEAQAPLPMAKPRRSRALVLLLLLVLAALAGGGAWWWLAEEKPPEIAGSIVLPAGMVGPVEVRVYRRGDLAAPWREFLASADARAAELGALISEAAQTQREKDLLFEQASRVHEVGMEYNMPDVAELKAERDACEAEFAEAQAAVRMLQAEQEGLFGWEGLLQVLPPPWRTAAVDEMGEFNMLRPGEDEVVLLAVGQEAEGGNTLCWLTVVEALVPGNSLEVVEFSDARRLDLEAVRRMAVGEGIGEKAEE